MATPMATSAQSASCQQRHDDAMDVDADDPAATRVFATDELVGVILAFLCGIRDRLSLAASCRALQTIVAQPTHWRAARIILNEEPARADSSPSLLGEALRALRPNTLESLQLHTGQFALLQKAKPDRSSSQIHPGMPLPDPPLHCIVARTALAFPRLVEMDVSGCRLDADVLYEAFRACGGTLRRLDVSRVRIVTEDPTGSCFRPYCLIARPNLLAPLAKLAVLVARETDPSLRPNSYEQAQRPASYSVLTMAHSACPVLETLLLGYDSEFRENPVGGPEAETEFSPPMWCIIGKLITPGGGSSCAPAAAAASSPSPPPEEARLQHLSLRGYVALMPQALHQLLSPPPPLHTLDLTGCQCLGPDRDDMGVLPATYASLAPTLTNLNVRGTAFDDACACALAAAGARLARLNASCTLLSGQGLVALAHASPRLRVLDLCYAKHCARDVADVAAAVARHTPGLEMLGLGGFERLSESALRAMLAGNEASMRHVGIGGCTGINGAAALRLVAEHCPCLTALNAHKLVEPTVSALGELLARRPALTSLDVHGCVWDHLESPLDDLFGSLVASGNAYGALLPAPGAPGEQEEATGEEDEDEEEEGGCPGTARAAARDGSRPLGLLGRDYEARVERWRCLGRSRVGEHFGNGKGATTVVQLGERAVIWQPPSRARPSAAAGATAAEDDGAPLAVE